MRRLLLAAVVLALAVPSEARPLDEPGARVDGQLNWTTIVPGRLALGSGGLDEDDVDYLAEQGFGAVLNLRVEHDDPEEALAAHDMNYLRVALGMAELDTFDPDEIDKSLAYIDAQMAEGRAVYVHCTAGWHRAAVVIAAWFMAQDNLTADDAWAKLEKLRPQVEPRWIDGLYVYEAVRDRKPQLEVDLRVPGTTAAPGEHLDVTASVTVGGRPYEGALVRFAAEYDDVDLEARTGPDGVVHFPLVMDKSRTQFLTAHATADGLISGYDRVAVWSSTTGIRPQEGFTLEVEGPADPVEPGSLAPVFVRAKETDGDEMNARISITDGERTLWRSYLEHDGRDVALIRAPDTPGVHVLDVRATNPYTDTVRTTVTIEVLGESAPPEPAPEPEPEPAPGTEEPPAEDDPPAPDAAPDDDRASSPFPAWMPYAGFAGLLALAAAGAIPLLRAARR